MSHWADYIKERENCDTIENEYGFITYALTPGQQCFIRDFFVTHEHRNKGYGKELWGELFVLALKHDCQRFVAQVDARAGRASHSLSVILAHGFKIVAAQNELITLVQEVSHGRSH